MHDAAIVVLLTVATTIVSLAFLLAIPWIIYGCYRVLGK